MPLEGEYGPSTSGWARSQAERFEGLIDVVGVEFQLGEANIAQPGRKGKRELRVKLPQDVNGMAAHLCAHVIYETLVLLCRQMGLVGDR